MPTLDAHIVKRRRELLVDVRLHLEQGERLALFGASGAGKSTVLSCLAGIENPDVGRIHFGDTVFFPPNLPLYQRPLAYLTQSDSLFPHLTVADNVCFGLRGHENNGAQPVGRGTQAAVSRSAHYGTNRRGEFPAARRAGSPWRGCSRDAHRWFCSTSRSPCSTAPP